MKPRTWELHRDIVRNHLVSALGHLLLQQLAGARHIRLHDLRHTWATLALQAKVPPAVVQERLGHASIAITLGTYPHFAPGMGEQAAATVAARW